MCWCVWEWYVVGEEVVCVGVDVVVMCATVGVGGCDGVVWLVGE